MMKHFHTGLQLSILIHYTVDTRRNDPLNAERKKIASRKVQEMPTKNANCFCTTEAASEHPVYFTAAVVTS